MIRKVKVYDTFIEGAKEGFQVAVRIIPFLVGILVAIGMFRASGAMDLLTNALRHALPGSGDSRPWGPIRLGLLQPGPCVLCAVADPSTAAPALQTRGSLAEPLSCLGQFSRSTCFVRL